MAVAADRDHLDDPVPSPGTRKTYRDRAGCFFRWAASRGLTLGATDQAALLAYKSEIAAVKSLHQASIYLSPVYGVLGRLAAAGILPRARCPQGRPGGRAGLGLIADPPPSIPLAELKAAVRELDNGEEDEESFQAGLVMLAPLSLRTIDPEPISRFTGVPLPLVGQFAERLLSGDGLEQVLDDDHAEGYAPTSVIPPDGVRPTVTSGRFDGPSNQINNWDYAGLMRVFNACEGEGLGLHAAPLVSSTPRLNGRSPTTRRA
jgi:hypothetical protein